MPDRLISFSTFLSTTSAEPSGLSGERALRLLQSQDDLTLHRWLCGLAAALVPVFGFMAWNASAGENPGLLPPLGGLVLFGLFGTLLIGSLRSPWIRQRLPALARPLYSLLLAGALLGGILQTFSTEYLVMLLLAYLLAGVGLSVGLKRRGPLAVYVGMALLFVGVAAFRVPEPPVNLLVIAGFLAGATLVALVVLETRIRAQRRLQAMHARYRVLAENATDLITLHNPDNGTCCYASPASRTLLGYAPEELEGRSLMDLAAPPSQNDIRKMMEALGRTGDAQHSVTARFEHKDGTSVWLDLHGHRSPHSATGIPSEIILVSRDVTAQRKHERQLRRERNDARQSLRASRNTARAKTTILAAMGHEVRMPLVSLLGFADMLTKRAEGNEARKDDTRNLVTLIQQSAQDLLTMLDSILDLARIEAGAMAPAPRPVPLAAHLRKAAERVRPRAEAKGLAFHLDLPDETCAARVDPTLLSHIVNNLVTNALKFTDEGSVTLRAHCVRSDQVALRVEDTGHGLSSNLRSHLFEAFNQAPKRANDSTPRDDSAGQGAGLGLFVVEHLVDQCGGTIFVDAAEGDGTRFTVRLPRAESVSAEDAAHAEEAVRSGPSSHAAGAPPETALEDVHPGSDEDGADRKTHAKPEDEPSTAPLESAKVLVVDDHVNTRRLIKRMLQPPHRVVTTPGVAAALDAARQHDFDVLLLDINLEGSQNGIDLLKKIRQLPGYATTPAVAVTAYAASEDRPRLLKAGFDNYLAKPFKREQLASRVRMARASPATP